MVMRKVALVGVGGSEVGGGDGVEIVDGGGERSERGGGFPGVMSDEERSSGGGETFEGLESGFVPFPAEGFWVVAHLMTFD